MIFLHVVWPPKMILKKATRATKFDHKCSVCSTLVSCYQSIWTCHVGQSSSGRRHLKYIFAKLLPCVIMHAKKCVKTRNLQIITSADDNDKNHNHNHRGHLQRWFSLIVTPMAFLDDLPHVTPKSRRLGRKIYSMAVRPPQSQKLWLLSSLIWPLQDIAARNTNGGAIAQAYLNCGDQIFKLSQT
jgi:hypothetical protein